MNSKSGTLERSRSTYILDGLRLTHTPSFRDYNINKKPCDVLTADIRDNELSDT